MLQTAGHGLARIGGYEPRRVSIASHFVSSAPRFIRFNPPTVDELPRSIPKEPSPLQVGSDVALSPMGMFPGLRPEHENRYRRVDFVDETTRPPCGLTGKLDLQVPICSLFTACSPVTARQSRRFALRASPRHRTQKAPRHKCSRKCTSLPRPSHQAKPSRLTRVFTIERINPFFVD